MKISFELLEPDTKKWHDAAKEIGNVSWKAGKFLSEKMIDNQFSDWESVIIGKTFEDDLACFCVVSKEDGLVNSKVSPFISFVFVREEYRGNRLSEKLLEYAQEYLKRQMFQSVYIVSGEIGLYEKYGFKKIESCETIYGDVENLYHKKLTI